MGLLEGLAHLDAFFGELLSQAAFELRRSIPFLGFDPGLNPFRDGVGDRLAAPGTALRGCPGGARGLPAKVVCGWAHSFRWVLFCPIIHFRSC